MLKILLFTIILVSSKCWDPLVASNPSGATQALYKRLCDAYGSYTFSGNTEDQVDAIRAAVGFYPNIRGYDMQNYSPHNPWHSDWSPWDDGSVQRAIDYYNWSNGQGIVEFHWHWFSPTKGEQRTSTFYIDHAGGFDVSLAVQPGTEEYYATIRDIDAIAVQLKRLQAANVPVLWRPLHEASGNQWNTPWFWWGAKGPGALKSLWNLMFQRLNSYHNLNNLIWVYSVNWDNQNTNWYPGVSQVDIVGIDSYPGAYNYDCQGGSYNNLHSMVNARKLIAITEHGPVPNIDTCFQNGYKWSFFIGWSTLTQQQNDPNHLYNVYHSSRVFHL